MGKHIVFIGCGTGRSGTVSLARLITRCRGFYCTHEALPLLSWEKNESIYQKKLEIIEHAGLDIGDVHSAYLPYLEKFIKDIPDIRIVCTLRDTDKVVRSFENKIGPQINHWLDHKGEDGWIVNKKWDPTFPKYEITDRHRAIEQYVTDYKEEINRLCEKYPKNILIIDISDLSAKAGQRKIFKFIGIKPWDRYYPPQEESVFNGLTDKK